MANYSISYTNTSVTFSVTGLSSGNEVRLYVRYEPNTGSAVVDQVYTATSSTLSRTFRLSSNKKYAANCRVSGTWIGAKYFSTGSDEPDPEPEPTRPSDWSWSSRLSKGSPINLRASEWNNFLNRINQFRDYKGLSDYGFTRAVSGRPMTASQVNQARSAIGGIPGHGTLPSSAVSGDTVTASFFNGLMNALNAV